MQHLCFRVLVNLYLWSGQKWWCFFQAELPYAQWTAISAQMHLVSPSSFQRKEGDDGVTCLGQKNQQQRICVDDFDCTSPKELIWPVFECRTQTRGLTPCTSAFRLEGFPKALCCSTLPGSAFNLATTRGWREVSLPSKREN